MSLFTDSINLYVEDVHIIVGPNTQHVAKLEDYSTDANSFYDITDPFTNIVRMMKQVRLKEAEEKKEQTAEEAKKKQDAKKKRAADREKDKKSKDKPESTFKALPGTALSYLFSIFNGIKFYAYRVHVRYEDDYFN